MDHAIIPMPQLLERLRSAPPRAALLLVTCLPGLAASSPLGAPEDPIPQRWLASSLSPVVGPVDGDDGSVLRLEVDQPARTEVPLAGWLALAGFRPSDVDALGLRPGFEPGHRGALAFSLLSNEGGFLDGDVLGLAAAGGLEVLVPEEQLAVALGLPGANLDLDALDFDDSGRLCFSLQSDLTGTSLGDVANGDVLRLDPDGTATRVFTEADVQQALTGATGLLGAVGDVHGLAVCGDTTWVAVQGPSVADGTALRLGSSPVLAVDELRLGLGGAELDALVALEPGYRRGCLALDQDLSVPGAALTGFGTGFEPSAPVAVLATGGQAPGLDLGLGGFGELVLDLLDPALAGSAPTVLVADAQGAFQVGFQLPTGTFGGQWLGTWGWTFQALDLVTLELSPPIRVEL